MIISIRGTSGCGKSHLARRVMDHYPSRKLFRWDDSKLMYAVDLPGLRVLGRYETSPGFFGSSQMIAAGADTFRQEPRDRVFKFMEESAARGDVLYEGLLISNEVHRTVDIAKRYPTHIFFLDTPLAVCLESVNERRAAWGKPGLASWERTVSRHRELMRVYNRLLAFDSLASVQRCSREMAYRGVCNLLGLQP